MSAELTLGKIIALAAADSVNPCVLAILTVILVSVLTYNPKNKLNVLLTGLSFTASVYVLYLFYGLVIIRSMQVVQALTSIRLLLYQILGVVAIILGLLNLKDFIWYKSGGFMTEMPMFLRPHAIKLVSSVTNPKGAFVMGALVTIFLLPCTIGPYIIAGGILSAFDLMKTVPWLLLYNAIFVLPMISVTGVIYIGLSTVQNVAEWKDKNIKYLHLVAGLLIMGIGIGMLTGLF